MDLGFQTIGNATLICFDRGPILATDPWLDGSACHGSLVMTHEVPETQQEAVARSAFIWLSHDAADHVHPPSLARLRQATILLPDHAGGRLRRRLESEGHRVQVLPEAVWVSLSDRLKVFCISDVFQDAVLLVDLGGRLIINANDAVDRGVGATICKIAQSFEISYLLSGIGHEGGMTNFVSPDGGRIPPPKRRGFLGGAIEGLMNLMGVTYFIPFSGMHRYQRADSIWANEFLTPLDAHFAGFHTEERQVLPPFMRWEFTTGALTVIDPRETPDGVVTPEELGDSWEETLDANEVLELEEYFRTFEVLQDFLGFLELRVGGTTHLVYEAERPMPRGYTFEAPRGSLMRAVRCEAFGDLLAGNFVRGIARGDWGHRTGAATLSPEFLPFVVRIGELGGARGAGEIATYAGRYWQRGFLTGGGDPARLPVLHLLEKYRKSLGSRFSPA